MVTQMTDTLAVSIPDGALLDSAVITAGAITTISSEGNTYTTNDGTSQISEDIVVMVDNDTVTANYAITLNATQTILQARINNIPEDACPIDNEQNYSLISELVNLTGNMAHSWTVKRDETENWLSGSYSELNIPSDGKCHSYHVHGK